jgi:hypothetical protein
LREGGWQGVGRGGGKGGRGREEDLHTSVRKDFLFLLPFLLMYYELLTLLLLLLLLLTENKKHFSITISTSCVSPTRYLFSIFQEHSFACKL